MGFSVGTDVGECGIGGKTPITASDEQRDGLTALAGSRDRGEADRHVPCCSRWLDQSADCRGVRRAGGHGSAVAQQFW